MILSNVYRGVQYTRFDTYIGTVALCYLWVRVERSFRHFDTDFHGTDRVLMDYSLGYLSEQEISF